MLLEFRERVEESHQRQSEKVSMGNGTGLQGRGRLWLGEHKRGQSRLNIKKQRHRCGKDQGLYKHKGQFRGELVSTVLQTNSSLWPWMECFSRPKLCSEQLGNKSKQ